MEKPNRYGFPIGVQLSFSDAAKMQRMISMQKPEPEVYVEIDALELPVAVETAQLDEITALKDVSQATPESVIDAVATTVEEKSIKRAYKRKP